MTGNAQRRTGWGGDPAVAPTVEEFEAAADRISGVAVRTPLVPLHSYEGGSDIWLKPEVLQPVGSFKVRGVFNWAASLSDTERSRGLSTTSAGNTAQALGYAARLFGVSARSLVPEWLPDNKTASLERYGVDLVRVPFDDLLDYMFEEGWRSEPYSYLNPWGQPELIAGHGTASLEILEDMDDVDSVFVPVGGGGLIAGVGSALKARGPSVRVVAVQAAANPALRAALDAGRSVWIEWRATICEGASVPIIVDEMLPLLRSVVDDLVLVTEGEVRDAVRFLALRNKLVAEGAGASAFAAALKTPVEKRGKTVCIVSGGSIDSTLFSEILLDREFREPSPAAGAS
jgi:threonine dehydratase